MKIVAVKELIAGFHDRPVGLPQGKLLTSLFFFTKTTCALY